MGCGEARSVTRDMQLDSSEKLKSTFSGVDLSPLYRNPFLLIFLVLINSTTYVF